MYLVFWLIFSIPLSQNLLANDQDQDGYYAIVYGFQDQINRPEASHTFASFIKVTPSDSNSDHRFSEVEVGTISWLPKTGQVLVVAPLPEEGLNFSLLESLGIAMRRQLQLKRWGPVKIDSWLYQRAMDRIEFLQSGRVQYKADDTWVRNSALSNEGGAVNCVHAVSDIAGNLRSSLSWGFPASEQVFNFFGPHILDANPETTDWLAVRLNVSQIPRAR
jgi:hypothetical protein